MAENPDYILDLSSAALPADRSDEPAPTGQGASAGGDVPGEHDPGPPASRKWIGVHFQCCDVYSRIWRNREGTAYVGYCPRCQRRIQAKIGPDGVATRFFTAG